MLRKTFYSLLWLFMATITPSILQSEIIVSDKIESVLPLIDKDTLVLFNASDVMYQHTSVLADVTFREHFAQRTKQIVSNEKIADQIINKIRGILVTQLPQKNVEEITPNLIASLQDQKIPVLGITQKRITTPYAKDFAGITSQYLVKLGIHLEKTLSYVNLAENEGDANYFFIHGLVFTQNKPVGPGIVSFLERNHYFPKRVVMVDNSTECLNEAEEALKQKGIEFKGLQYTATDGFKESVSVTLATIEFFELMNQGRVMLDEEAKQMECLLNS